MATIPIGNFGNITPQATQGRVLDTGANHIAQAGMNIAQAGQQYVNQEQAKQLKLQEEQDEYAFGIESAKFGADYSDAHAEVKRKVSLGQLSHEDAEIELSNKQKELTEYLVSQVPQSRQEKFKSLTEQAYIRSTVDIKPLAMKVEQDNYLSKYSRAFENTLKIGDRALGTVNIESVLRHSPHLTEGQKLEELSKWHKRKDLLDFDYKFDGIQHDNEKLKQLQHQIKETFKYVSAEQQVAMNNKIQDQIERNQIKAYEKDKKHEREIEADVREFGTLASTGRPIDPTYLEEIRAKAKGTKHEAYIERDLAVNEALRSVAKLSLTEQEKYLSDLKAKTHNTPVSDDSIERKVISSLESIVSQNQILAKKDGVAFYQKQTGAQLYTPQATELINGKFDQKQLAITIKTLTEQRSVNGSGSLNPLTPSEQVVLRDRFKVLSPKDKAIVVRNLDLASGGNAEARKEIFNSVVGEKRFYEMMSVSYLESQQTRFTGNSANNGKLTSQAILEGYEMIDKGLAKGLSPSAEEYRRAFALAVPKNLVAGTPGYQAAYNNVLAAYLSLQKDSGGVEIDSKGRVVDADEKGFPPLNQELFKEAYDSVTGGTYSQKLGSATNKINRPLGVTEDEMREQLESGVRNAHTSVKKMYAKDFMRIYAVTPTNKPYTYQFTLRGEAYEINGKPLEVIVKPK